MESVEEMYSESMEEPSLAESLESDAKPEEVMISSDCKFDAKTHDDTKYDLYMTRRGDPDYFIKVLGYQYDEKDVEEKYPVKVIYNDCREKDNPSSFGNDSFTLDGKLYADRGYYERQHNLLIKVPKGHIPVTERNVVISKPVSLEINYTPVPSLINGFINIYKCKIVGTENTIITAGKVNMDFESAMKKAALSVTTQSPWRFDDKITAETVEHLATINIADHPAVKAVLIEKGLLT
jgi:hypothetical protein